MAIGDNYILYILPILTFALKTSVSFQLALNDCSISATWLAFMSCTNEQKSDHK